MKPFEHLSSVGGQYSYPSILRPPMGPRKCGLILQVVIQHRNCPFGTKASSLIIKGGLKIEGCKVEGLTVLNLLPESSMHARGFLNQ